MHFSTTAITTLALGMSTGIGVAMAMGILPQAAGGGATPFFNNLDPNLNLNPNSNPPPISRGGFPDPQGNGDDIRRMLDKAPEKFASGEAEDFDTDLFPAGSRFDRYRPPASSRAQQKPSYEVPDLFSPFPKIAGVGKKNKMMNKMMKMKKKKKVKRDADDVVVEEKSVSGTTVVSHKSKEVFEGGSET